MKWDWCLLVPVASCWVTLGARGQGGVDWYGQGWIGDASERVKERVGSEIGMEVWIGMDRIGRVTKVKGLERGVEVKKDMKG